MKPFFGGFFMGFLITLAAGGSGRAAVFTGIGFALVSLVMTPLYGGSTQE